MSDCCLCSQPYEGMGKNPEPLTTGGRCCDACDQVVTEARLSLATIVAEIERVEYAMLPKVRLLRQCAIAAICASRGPALWAQRQRERAQLMAMLDRDEDSD